MNLFCLSFFAFLLSATTAFACPKQVPEGLVGVNVGSNVVTNGLLMSISQVQGKETVEAILARTEKNWNDAGYSVKRSTTVGWQVLAAMGNRCLVTLQLNNSNGSFGYLTRSYKSIASVATPQSMGAPIPANAKLTSTVSSNDDGRNGMVISMTSRQSMDELNQFFMEQLTNNKWTAPRSHRVNAKKNGGGSLFVSAQKDRKQIEIVIWPEHETQIVMTISEAL